MTAAAPETLEIEMKFPVTDCASVRSQLEAWSIPQEPARQDADHYFNAPDRDFARTDEALRLRRIDSANCVTYKGPKVDALTKTRTEIEVPLAPGDQAAEDFGRLLVRLGYRPVRLVRKRRHVYHVTRSSFALAVCLDDVEELGAFVELEIIAPANQLEPARAVLLQVAAELGLTQPERRSYLEMLLAKESGVRSQESGVRSQESGVRSQESEVRSQKSGVRSQESE